MNAYRLSDERIQNGDFWPCVEACYSRTWEQHAMIPHYHNRAEIMYALKGECIVQLYEYRTDDRDGSIHITRQWSERLRPGDFILLDQGILHAIMVPETTYMLNAEFRIGEDDQSALSMRTLAQNSPEFLNLLRSGNPIQRSHDEEGRVLHALEQVVQEFSRTGVANKTLSDVLLAELLLQVASLFQKTSMKEDVRSYIRHAEEYIEEHLCSDLRVDDIAAHVNLAPAYLQRIFKRATGVTIVQYINQERIERSKRLLMYTDDAIVDIAVASGFNSRQHFFRVFNSVTQMSPQQFRQEYRSRSVKQLYLFDKVGDHSLIGNHFKVTEREK